MIHKLKGKVKSGFGEASFWVKKIIPFFKDKYGIILFPGTLNIELNVDYIVPEIEKIKPKEYGGDYYVFIQKCKVLDDICYIVRPEINNNTKGKQTMNVIEIVSNVELRKKYNLKDNDDIEIELLD